MGQSYQAENYSARPPFARYLNKTFHSFQGGFLKLELAKFLRLFEDAHQLSCFRSKTSQI